jgi:tetratricopeptide (TPR) repeat protein
MLSELMTLSGRPTEALADIQKALRLNPHPPGWYYWFLGQAQYLDRQYDRAVQSLRREETYRTPSRRILAASLAQLGRLDEARREAAMFMARNHPSRSGIGSSRNRIVTKRHVSTLLTAIARQACRNNGRSLPELALL